MDPSGERFEFGANWTRFLGAVDEERIEAAVESLREMLEVDRLDGRTFLDAGSGSGLFSLAARRLGATVTSFDYDPQSVECTRELRLRYAIDDSAWRVEPGSVLDDGFLDSLGSFDVVYSWGVLHHTGRMWDAIDLVSRRVAAGGTLYISIYNDQGRLSRYWTSIKRRYNRHGPITKKALVGAVGAGLAVRFGLNSLRRAATPQRRKAPTARTASMSRYYDLIDWVGGYPFEVATPDEIVNALAAKGFALHRLRTVGRGHGCNEFVFHRVEVKSAAPPLA